MHIVFKHQRRAAFRSTTSDVYVFVRNACLDQRVAALESVPVTCTRATA